jgi:hypothetical protein
LINHFSLSKEGEKSYYIREAGKKILFEKFNYCLNFFPVTIITLPSVLDMNHSKSSDESKK